MRLETVGEVIAERKLHRAQGEVIVRIGRPALSGHGDWYCPFEITGLPNGPILRATFGVDAVQALELVHGVVGALLDYWKRELDGDLYFEQPGDDLGFPLPVRELQASKIEPDLDCLVIELKSGTKLSIPWGNLSRRLAEASASERSVMELSPSGYGIHWPLLDEDLAIGPIVTSSIR